MMESEIIRVLAVDHEATVVDDYRHMLCNQAVDDVAMPSDLERELFGRLAPCPGLPEVDLATCLQAQQGLEAVRQALGANKPFAIAFLEMGEQPAYLGLECAARIRALDPEIHIVMVTGCATINPVEMTRRLAPADKLLLLRKPFHAFEVQQLVLNLAAKWRIERSQARQDQGFLVLQERLHSGIAQALRYLPAGFAAFDSCGRLLVINKQMVRLYPELSAVFQAGTRYEDIQLEIARRLLPEDTVFSIDAWVRERMKWHANSGGIFELRLRGERWMLVAESSGPEGEVYSLHFDITEPKRRAVDQSIADRMTNVAQVFAAFCKHFALRRVGPDDCRGSVAVGSPSKKDGDVVVHSMGGPFGDTVSEQCLNERLNAIAQRQVLAPEALDLNPMMGEVARQVRGEASAAVELEVITGAGLWKALVDKGKLRPVVRELLRNANEAMPHGGRLTLETANVRLTRDNATRAGLVPGDYVRLSIRDTGPGMPPKLLERAVSPFFTSKQGGEHLGLGLSVAYGFAHQSGGHLEIESGEGSGTSAHLYFPRAHVSSASLSVKEPRGAEEARSVA